MKTFRQALQNDRLALTAELTLKREDTAQDVLSRAQQLASRVDAVQVNDNPYGWVQMSAVAVAGILLPHGIDVVPILTARDRNRIALKSELMGLRALGVTSILLSRGHKVPKSHELPAMTVFDTTGRDLIALARTICEESDQGPERELFVGTGIRVFRPKPAWSAESLRSRVKSGAQFAQSQLCFNTTMLRHYMKLLVENRLTWDYSVIISLAVIPDAATAHWLKKNMSDSLIPKPLIERLDKAADPRAEGVAICAELMREIAEVPGVSGINLVSLGDAGSIVEAIDQSGLAKH